MYLLIKCIVLSDCVFSATGGVSRNHRHDDVDCVHSCTLRGLRFHFSRGHYVLSMLYLGVKNQECVCIIWLFCACVKGSLFVLFAILFANSRLISVKDYQKEMHIFKKAYFYQLEMNYLEKGNGGLIQG